MVPSDGRFKNCRSPSSEVCRNVPTSDFRGTFRLRTASIKMATKFEIFSLKSSNGETFGYEEPFEIDDDYYVDDDDTSADYEEPIESLGPIGTYYVGCVIFGVYPGTRVQELGYPNF